MNTLGWHVYRHYVITSRYMYVQMIGGICGSRVIKNDNKNGGNSLDTGIH